MRWGGEQPPESQLATAHATFLPCASGMYADGSLRHALGAPAGHIWPSCHAHGKKAARACYSASRHPGGPWQPLSPGQPRAASQSRVGRAGRPFGLVMRPWHCGLSTQAPRLRLDDRDERRVGLAAAAGAGGPLRRAHRAGVGVVRTRKRRVERRVLAERGHPKACEMGTRRDGNARRVGRSPERPRCFSAVRQKTSAKRPPRNPTSRRRTIHAENPCRYALPRRL